MSEPTPEETREIASMDESMTADEAAELNSLLDQAEAEDEENPTPQPPDDPGLSEQEEQAPPTDESTPEGEGENKDKEGEPDTPLASKQEGDGQENEQEPEPDKPLDGKTIKEMQRRDKSWQKLNEEKEQLKAERDKLEREQAEIRRIQTEQAKPKYSADDYERAAEEFESQGKYETAELARAEAERLRKMPDANQAAIAAQQTAQFEASQNASWEQAKTQFPGVLDKGNPLNQALVQFLNDNPDYLQTPNGPYRAAEFVNAKVEASRVSELTKENESLKTKVQELEKATTISPSGEPYTPRGEKSFEEMSVKEQEAYLDREFAQA